MTSYDGIVSNLVDLAGFSEDLKRFRSCLHCKEVLEQRDKRLRMTTAADPDLVKYYTHLQSILDEGMYLNTYISISRIFFFIVIFRFHEFFLCNILISRIF